MNDELETELEKAQALREFFLLLAQHCEDCKCELCAGKMKFFPNSPDPLKP